MKKYDKIALERYTRNPWVNTISLLANASLLFVFVNSNSTRALFHDKATILSGIFVLFMSIVFIGNNSSSDKLHKFIKKYKIKTYVYNFSVLWLQLFLFHSLALHATQFNIVDGKKLEYFKSDSLSELDYQNRILNVEDLMKTHLHKDDQVYHSLNVNGADYYFEDKKSFKELVLKKGKVPSPIIEKSDNIILKAKYFWRYWFHYVMITIYLFGDLFFIYRRRLRR